MISKPLLTKETMNTEFLIHLISEEMVFIPMDLTTVMIIYLNTKLIRERTIPIENLMIFN
jgi:hypothetical protein